MVVVLRQSLTGEIQMQKDRVLYVLNAEASARRMKRNLDEVEQEIYVKMLKTMETLRYGFHNMSERGERVRRYVSKRLIELS